MQIAASAVLSRFCISSIRKSAPGLCLLGDLSDLDDQLAEVLFGVAGVGDPGGGLDVELELHRAGDGDAECLHHAEGAVDAILDPVLAAHLAQQPCGHAGEGDAEVWLGADLLHVGGRPARLAGEDVELEQQDCLTDAAQAGVDQAAFVAAAALPFDQRLHVLQVGVAAGEDTRLAACAGGVGVVAFVHQGRFCHFLRSEIGCLENRREARRRRARTFLNDPLESARECSAGRAQLAGRVAAR